MFSYNRPRLLLSQNGTITYDLNPTEIDSYLILHTGIGEHFLLMLADPVPLVGHGCKFHSRTWSFDNWFSNSPLNKHQKLTGNLRPGLPTDSLEPTDQFGSLLSITVCRCPDNAWAQNSGLPLQVKLLMQ